MPNPILKFVALVAFFFPAATSVAALLDTTSSDFRVLRLTPDRLDVAPGERFTVDLTLSGLSDGAGDFEIAGGFDINLLFTDDTITFAGYRLGDGLGDVALGESTDLSVGQVDEKLLNFSQTSNLTQSELGGLQQETVTLVTLEFTATDVVGSSGGIFVAFYPRFFDASGAPFELTSINVINDGTQIRVVPLPAALWLLSGALVLIPRKTRKTAAL